MTELKWIAVDWGTTHLRVWGMNASGIPLFHVRSDQRMGALEADAFEPTLMALIKAHVPDLDRKIDVIACGRVGALKGRADMPYCAVPCQPLAGGLTKLSSDQFNLNVISGLKQTQPFDLMQGEEVQIAGYLAGDKEFDGVVCLPGLHSKWVRVSAEEVVSFQTVMTGEMFDALSDHSVLQHSLAQTGLNEELFLETVSEGMAHPARLSSRLFSLHAESLLSGLSAEDVRTRLSGLLIGMELAATKPYWLGQKIVLIGDHDLSCLYAKALTEQGCMPIMVEAEDMIRNGLIAAYGAVVKIEGV
ncbi:2-dehydro-3-deoxygalactonokinase [Cohaesibacter celericrescens]|uniref:2-keto-3-deoxy-galactonokinase n=1 Tax=Cohaesibacter celericrescens TaxID=2067669 RepID=A0A2N5XWC2_9HYPH|nr:2-dehydro-3-deoxygalactonokinase [Cohaesibacter celericrescens]PLW78816.1 2-keto-3-deoxy-galactonokinase [Cohaesibacter celericrescens]